MNIKEYISKFISLFTGFPYEWRKILKENDKDHYYFLAYSSIFSGISFLLGALWFTGLKVGFEFILFRSLVFALSVFAYIFIVSLSMRIITSYYHLKIQGITAEKLVTYTSVYYLSALMSGALLSPENYFFFVFFLSFFSAYYFYRVFNKSLEKQIIAIFSGLLLYFFHLTSYFILVNILASLSI